jgi:hypothetical protein
MSNHDGSRMLNDVIALLRREGVFDRLGKVHSRRIVSEMITRAVWEHDCNHSEILDGHGASLGLCWDGKGGTRWSGCGVDGRPASGTSSSG